MSQLAHKVNTFRVGSITRHFATWNKFASDKDILSTVSGMFIEFFDFLAIGTNFEMKFSAKEETIFSKKIIIKILLVKIY